MSERQQGVLWVLLAALGYAFLPIITRNLYAVATLSPTDIGIWRFLFATPMVWIIVLGQERAQRRTVVGETNRQRLLFLAMGILYAFTALAAFTALQFIPASTFTVLFYTYPAMVAILGLFLGIPLSLIGWGALALTTVGIILTVPNIDFSGGANVWTGIIWALANAFGVAIYFLLVGRVMKSAPSVNRASAYVITGTLFTFLATFPFYGLAMPTNPQTWLLLLTLAFVSTVVPISVVNLGIQKIGATQASIINTAEPVVTLVLSALLLAEVILPIQWLGGLLIVLAVVLLQVPMPTRKRTEA